MECPHLCKFDKTLTSPNLRTLKDTKIVGKSHKSTQSKRSHNTQHCCKVCKSDRSPWMCVICGQIHCGRYVNSHAKAHYEENDDHFLAICCLSRNAFCYACDDYVINEVQSKRIQLTLDQLQNSDPIENSSNGDTPQKVPDKDPTPKSSSIKSRRSKLTGIKNLGNTCYMNSVLQCLSNIQLFTSSVGQLKTSADDDDITTDSKKRKLTQAGPNVPRSDLLFEALRDTLYLIKKSGKSTIKPESFFTMLCKVPRFRGYQQQDAHEFLRYVLDRLHQECLENCPVPEKRANMCFNGGIESKKASIIGNIFGGILQNEVNCLECGFKSHKLDPFLDLSLDIPVQRATTNFDATSSDNSNSSYSVADECHLIDCLSSFIELEELTETELYYCSNCQQKQRSTKRFWIRRLPDVLCLHLKRFRWNNYLRTKLDNYIEFPIQGLDMKRFVMSSKHETRGSSCGPSTYDLVAFIEHHGSGIGSGHYTAYAFHDGFWYHFDDSSVTLCDESQVKQSKAYILFYSRKTNLS